MKYSIFIFITSQQKWMCYMFPFSSILQYHFSIPILLTIAFIYRYRNIYIRYLHIPSLVTTSPLKELWDKKVIQASRYLTSHLSDVMRFLILFHFGGTYLDLDALIIKELPKNVPNFIGREGWQKPFLGIDWIDHKNLATIQLAKSSGF